MEISNLPAISVCRGYGPNDHGDEARKGLRWEQGKGKATGTASRDTIREGCDGNDSQ
jgi:hypothetical protein